MRWTYIWLWMTAYCKLVHGSGCMVCTEHLPRWQQFHMAPWVTSIYCVAHNFGRYWNALHKEKSYSFTVTIVYNIMLIYYEARAQWVFPRVKDTEQHHVLLKVINPSINQISAANRIMKHAVTATVKNTTCVCVCRRTLSRWLLSLWKRTGAWLRSLRRSVHHHHHGNERLVCNYVWSISSILCCNLYHTSPMKLYDFTN